MLALGAALALLSACQTLSVSDEERLGYQFEQEVNSQFRFVHDRVVVGYLRDLGADVLRAAGPQPFEYQFFVVEDDDVNAFAGPAGHVYVHTGTILEARNVSELMGVVAHEVGHVVHRHIAENYGKQRAAGLGRQALVLGAALLGGSNAAGAANLLGSAGLAVALNSFGREAEREADDFAVDVMPRAGYDPEGLPSFFETLSRRGGGNGPTFLSSHPAPEDRIEATRTAIARQQLPPGLRRDDGGKLEIIQRRIRLLTGKERVGR